MSTLNKKLYIKKNNGDAVGCNIYSTAAEASDKALTVRADGIAGYVALKPITDSNATAGRVSIGGVTYAIATKHESGGGTAVPYTEKSWTAAGSYTFVIPDGISRVRVALCGGGAGKGAFGAGNTGGDTRAFDLFATGGEGGSAWTYGNGGTPNGYASDGNKVTDGFALSFDKASGDYGKGGNYGGSGGYDSQYVAVTAGQSYTLTVGGAGGSGGTGGFVLLAYGGDI
ncbi:hypothetical protein [Phascolarctobacterium succinatutens]|uniref:hypothetical protein n=1 Tax=Phascolarctobacterium succinatutens TaxID=626940 RepID=UPI0030773E2B